MILITGATGKSGSATARALNDLGHSYRALIRNPEKEEELKALGAEVVIGSIEDNQSLVKAMSDVEKVLILLPNSENQLALETQIVDVALQSGTKHIVKVSSIEATPDATSPIPKLHLEAENYIKASGLEWTMVKPNFYMQNLLGSATTIKEQDKIFLPMGEGKTGMIDTRDVGKVIAKVLSEEGHSSMNYEITGPEILSFYDVAETFSNVLNKTVNYIDLPMPAYKDILSNFLTNQWHLDAVIDLFEGIREGGIEEKTDTYTTLMGEPPKSLEEFIIEHSFIFKN
tara:strand:+ start:1674 stop:2531 length:858 start_codon:yes stop_codon:yes gene_type:complete